ncbi:hypothetical protein [Paraburkholderia sp. SIMBA_054]|jgi:hypothetical protein|uniref:hypothetical protein n=1 Tax=Paraburkholderia TaxID=1822464 RepID=UPI00397A2D6E
MRDLNDLADVTQRKYTPSNQGAANASIAPRSRRNRPSRKLAFRPLFESDLQTAASSATEKMRSIVAPQLALRDPDSEPMHARAPSDAATS